MADGTKFSRISITSDDDDDFVIQAGVVPAQPVDEPAQSEPIAQSAVVEPIQPEPAVQAQPEPVQSAAEAPAAQPRAPKRDDYAETTLEDLKGGGMSSMQKGIIVAALLGIIAFAAWYIVM